MGWARDLFDGTDATDDDLETFLANEVEGPAVTALREFCGDQPGREIELPPELTRYLAWAAARCLPMRDLMEMWISQLSEGGCEPVVDLSSPEMRNIKWIDRTLNMKHPRHGLRSNIQPEEFAQLRREGWELVLGKDDFIESVRLQAYFFQKKHFPSMNWHLLRVPPGKHFVIGDRPVFWGFDGFSNSGPGVLKHHAAQMIASLTPSLALLATHPDGHSPRVVLPSNINGAVLAAAHMWVAGPEEKGLQTLLANRTLQ